MDRTTEPTNYPSDPRSRHEAPGVPFGVPTVKLNFAGGNSERMRQRLTSETIRMHDELSARRERANRRCNECGGSGTVNSDGSWEACATCRATNAGERDAQHRDDLVEAIRSLTVHADDGTSGVIGAINALLEIAERGDMPDEVCEVIATLCAALTKETRALREAAEVYLGGSFGR